MPLDALTPPTPLFYQRYMTHATQEDARETKEQLRLYMTDYVLWRDRAKHLEVTLNQLRHRSPTEGRNDKPLSSQFHEGGEIMSSVGDGTRKSSAAADGLSSPKGDSRDARQGVPAGHQQVDGNGGIGELLPLPDRRTNDDLKTTHCAALHFSAADQRRESAPVAGQSALSSRGDTGTASPGRGSVQGQGMAAEKLGSTGMGFETSSVAAKSYFERSMRAQQEGSARLERELAKARADLDSLLGHNSKGAGSPAPSPPGEEEDELAARDCVTGKEEGEGRIRVGGGRESNSASRNQNNAVEGRPSNDVDLLKLLSFPTEAAAGGIIGDGYDDRLDGHAHPVEIADDDIALLPRRVGDGAVAGDVQRATLTDTISTTGPHMARVLAALLGREEAVTGRTLAQSSRSVTCCTHVRNAALTASTTAATTGIGGVGVGGKNNGNNASAGTEPIAAVVPRLLSDYPPILQAVFGTGVGNLPLAGLAATTTAPLPYPTGNDPPVVVGTRKSSVIAAEPEPRMGASDADLAGPEHLLVQIASDPTPSGVCIGSGIGATESVGTESKISEARTASCVVRHPAMASASVGGVVGAAFRGYEAKSPLLQRWLAERA